MTLTLTKLTSNDAIALLERQLDCVADARGLQMAIAAEHIRGALYANAARTSGLDVSPAVHTTRLLTSSRKTLDLLWTKSAVAAPPGQSDSAQLALDSLALLGDVVDTGGGFWIGTPLRLISSAEDAALTVMGALPSSLVNTLTGGNVSSVGSARFVRQPTISNQKRFDAYIQSTDDWLGHEEPLNVWTHRLLAQLRTSLTPSGDVTADQLEIYAPDLFAVRRQNGRWFEARQLTQAVAGLRLCRPLSTVSYEWKRPFFLAEIGFRSGQPTLARSVPVDYDLTQRFRFGLDLLLQVPRRVTLITGAETFDLDLPYDLPQPESRVLGFGWPSLSHVGRRTFHNHAKPVIARAFERLGVRVETRRKADV